MLYFSIGLKYLINSADCPKLLTGTKKNLSETAKTISETEFLNIENKLI
ncbi:hypothetical protein M092_0131 [Parabacteroides distasonis str. 3776 D15 iv]|uniref:Uncharacterized protein n=1 Tax=Parabacteroides distasonis str. 3776 D15 i TaxID=1339342 RepID=A0AB34LED3_PARDI|nr:hypothetical protein M091_0043 [Parabacteroides distasonis str. 3776 D15 i]KDS43859.1 hypothetical protein M090_4647 [Parabacteroides distasonis str. 3776 Po2 i]KDS73959.1 hypothetical protein M092_0131 [Parabacteroides distasonis str. 3776 D15 iv]